jgi:hypothetical protein
MKRTLALFLLLTFCSTASADGARRVPFWKSRRFWIPFALTVASASADFAATQISQANGHTEMNPFFLSSRPSFGRMLGMDLPGEFAVSYAAYRYPGKLSSAAVAADVFSHSFFAARNLRLSSPRPAPPVIPAMPAPPAIALPPPADPITPIASSSPVNHTAPVILSGS